MHDPNKARKNENKARISNGGHFQLIQFTIHWLAFDQNRRHSHSKSYVHTIREKCVQRSSVETVHL